MMQTEMKPKCTSVLVVCWKMQIFLCGASGTDGCQWWDVREGNIVRGEESWVCQTGAGWLGVMAGKSSPPWRVWWWLAVPWQAGVSVPGQHCHTEHRAGPARCETQRHANITSPRAQQHFHSRNMRRSIPGPALLAAILLLHVEGT